MRLIEKKIRDRIKLNNVEQKSIINQIKEEEKMYIAEQENKTLEWVLSELQKESDLMQEFYFALLDCFKMINPFKSDMEGAKKWLRARDIIEKVKQEMSEV